MNRKTKRGQKMVGERQHNSLAMPQFYIDRFVKYHTYAKRVLITTVMTRLLFRRQSTVISERRDQLFLSFLLLYCLDVI